jgi:hypothetical protein
MRLLDIAAARGLATIDEMERAHGIVSKTATDAGLSAAETFAALCVLSSKFRSVEDGAHALRDAILGGSDSGARAALAGLVDGAVNYSDILAEMRKAIDEIGATSEQPGPDVSADLAVEPVDPDPPKLATAADLAEAVSDDGRRYRWSRVELSLDSRQQVAIDRALAAAETTADRSDAETVKAVSDQLRADGFEDCLTDEGFFLVSVLAARTGTQLYGNGIETWGEYRSDEEVEASCPSYALKPFTDDHPSELVVPSNYTIYAKGSCGQDAELLLLPEADGRRYVRVTILVGDLATLRKIRNGKVELSCGYTTIPVADRGTDPFGDEYRYRQTKIRINHLALVDAGRAGPLARISVDGSAWEVPLALDSAPTKDNDIMLNLSDACMGSMRDMVASSYSLGDAMRSDEVPPEAMMAVAEMLMSMAKAAMMGEEMAAEDMSKLVDMTGMSPEAATDMMKRPDAVASVLAEPALMDVEIADGIVAKMTADTAAAWEAEKAKRTDAVAAKTAVEKNYAQLRGDHDALTKRLARLELQADADARKALCDRLADVCPDVVKAWTPTAKGKAYADGLTIVDMKAAALIDLDASWKGDLESAKAEMGDAFAAYVSRTFDREFKSATRRAEQSETTVDDSKVVNFNRMIKTAAYGG